jgi:hypothetical protein
MTLVTSLFRSGLDDLIPSGIVTNSLSQNKNCSGVYVRSVHKSLEDNTSSCISTQCSTFDHMVECSSLCSGWADLQWCLDQSRSRRPTYCEDRREDDSVKLPQESFYAKCHLQIPIEVDPLLAEHVSGESQKRQDPPRHRRTRVRAIPWLRARIIGGINPRSSARITLEIPKRKCLMDEWALTHV